MKKEKKDWKIYIPLTIVILLVIVGGTYWYIDYTSYIRTDDAVVASDNVSVSPKIMGRISKVYVDEGDSVNQGQLLAEIDSVDLIAQKQQVIALKLQTIANKSQAEAKLQFDEKNIKILQIALEKSKEDFVRAKAQYTGGVITKEQFEHLEKAEETSKAQLEAAQAQILVSRTMIKSAETAVTGAQAQIGVISSQLNNTRLYSPVSGIVAKRWLLPGDIAQPSQSIFTINNNSKFWIQVFLEETKIENLHIGQKAIFSLDTYPNVVFTGKVYTIGSTTASQFSLIPPNNASGNFTKITQRVAVRISVLGTKDGQKLSKFNLLTGMSAVVKIIK